MVIDSAFQYLPLTLEVFFLDLLLSGDNAIVIALACRSLPIQQRRQAMVIGTFVAIVLRIVLTLIASAVLQVPVLKLLGGIALMVIAIQLTLDDPGPDNNSGNSPESDSKAGGGNLWSVVWTVILADLVMSTDNVVALAAVAKGSLAVLALGLLLSVPILMFGSWYVTRLLQRYPVLTRLGGAMLGWFAGDIAVSDPLYASWVEHQSPALIVVVPALIAVFVLLQSRIIDQSRAGAAAMRPQRRVRVHVAANPSESGLMLNSDQLAVRATTPDLPTRQKLPDDVNPDQVSAISVDQLSIPVAASARRGPLVTNQQWLVGAAVMLIVISVGYTLINVRWMPIPTALIQYDCPSKGISISYKRGTQKIHVTTDATSLDGTVFYDNKIEWADYNAATKSLGFSAPTRVLYADAKTLRVDGGEFEDVTCHAR